MVAAVLHVQELTHVSVREAATKKIVASLMLRTFLLLLLPIFLHGFALLLCGRGACQASIVPASCSHLWAAWLTPAAHRQERSIDLLLPPCRLPRWFGRKMQRKLEAGAGCEDLRTRCPYFYTVAQQLSALCTQDRLAPFVIRTFTNRYKVGQGVKWLVG